ncbi:MAG: hypothetical protein HFI09_00220 [Bacilli bacterium]|nr:hypothetical protein [Bacilli bacterium]
MTGLEMKKFYELDQHEYELKENKEIQMMYEYFKKYNSDFDLDSMTHLMNKIINFYEFKFPNELYDGSVNKDSASFQNMLTITSLLDLDQLESRIHHDDRQFLKCEYWDHVTLESTNNKHYSAQTHYIRIKNGFINPYDLRSLTENLINQDKATTPEELWALLSTKSKNVDYSELTKLLEYHNINVALRKRILELTALKMLYSGNTLPIYGYKRAKHLIKEFNEGYNLNLDDSKIDRIMFRDYGMNRLLLKPHDIES